MDAIAAAEERIVNKRLRQKLNQVNCAAQSHLSVVQDHVNFTFQCIEIMGEARQVFDEMLEKEVGTAFCLNCHHLRTARPWIRNWVISDDFGSSEEIAAYLAKKARTL